MMPRPFIYHVGSRQVELHPADDVIAVRFREPAFHSVRARVAGEVGLGPFARRFEIPSEKFTVFPVPALTQAPAEAAAQVRSRLAEAPEVSRAALVFRLRDRRVVATDRIIVRFTPEHDVNTTLQRLGARIVERSGNEYLLALPETTDPLAVVAELSGFPNVEYAEPDFVTIGHYPRSPGTAAVEAVSPAAVDIGYPMQLIGAERAWAIQRGRGSVRIAILDDGVETSHGALSPAIVDAYDAVLDAPLTAPNPWDGHGTACAGLAAAVATGDDSFQGVASGCSVTPVRIAQAPYPGGPWATTNSAIRRGIDWARERGADVLNNSWGGGPPSNAVIDALNRARLEGRGGKGCVLVVAAGNDSDRVDYPGNVAGVLTVAGTNQWDEYKTVSSRDGQTWWGSNYGPEVDVSAPSVHIRTTDLSGAGGASPGDYFDTFNGTSAAAPLVAGAAALVLSAQPLLSEAEVRRILCETADQVGPLPYPNSRNDRYGCGRLNVGAAVEAALGLGKGVPPTGAPGDPGAIPPGEVRLGYLEPSEEAPDEELPAGNPEDEEEAATRDPPAGEVRRGYREEDELPAGAQEPEPEPGGGEPPPGQIWRGYREEEAAGVGNT